MIVRSGCPVDLWTLARKVADFCDCSLCLRAPSCTKLNGLGLGLNYCSVSRPDPSASGSFRTQIWLNQRTIVRSFARIYQLEGLLVGVGLRCRASESVFGVGTTAQLPFFCCFLPFFLIFKSKISEQLLPFKVYNADII